MSKEICVVASFVVTLDSVLALRRECEQSADTAWLSKTCCCNIYGLRGVPQKRIDICIDQHLLDDSEWDCRNVIELQVVRKAGRYDGSQRDRLTLRVRQGHQCHDHRRSVISVGITDDAYRLDICEQPIGSALPSTVLWSRSFDRLRSDLSAYDPEALVMWHWTRYYQVPLSHDVARSVASEWALSEFAAQSARWTLAEANRSASRALYRAARDDGFRKLTLRERRKHGIPDSAGQWHRSDAVDGSWSTSGCGQATIDAAFGHEVSLCGSAAE